MEYVRSVCICLRSAWVERGVIGLGLGFTNPVGTGGVGRGFGLWWCGWFMWGVGKWFGPWSEGGVLCLCEF